MQSGLTSKLMGAPLCVFFVPLLQFSVTNLKSGCLAKKTHLT